MSETMLRRRMGRFLISDQLMHKIEFELVETFKKLGFIPFRVEHNYAEAVFEMCGVSPLFREVELGERIPFYNILVEKNDSELTVSVKELGK
jgi:hypothetical protein